MCLVACVWSFDCLLACLFVCAFGCLLVLLHRLSVCLFAFVDCLFIRSSISLFDCSVLRLVVDWIACVFTCFARLFDWLFGCACSFVVYVC